MRRKEMAERRRDEIIDAALSVFGSKGVDAASIKEVAAAAGVAPGLIYHYFASKEALALAAASERGFDDELMALLSEASGNPASVVIPRIMSGFDRLLIQRQALVGLFLSGSLSNPTMRQGLREMVAGSTRAFHAYLSERVAAGELRPHDPAAAIHALFSSVAYLHMSDQREYLDGIVDIILAGVLADPKID